MTKRASLRDLGSTVGYYSVLEAEGLTGRNRVLLRRWLKAGRIDGTLATEGSKGKWWISPRGVLEALDQPSRKGRQ